MWVTWVFGGLLLWSVVAVVLGLFVGRSVRLADRHEGVVAVEARERAVRRRRVPVPTPVLVAAGVGLALEMVGYVVRLLDVPAPLGSVLSMDAPGSLPRLYVATTFALAAAAALAGAPRVPGRRTWWAAVGVVAAGAAVVKAGGTLHADALAWFAARNGLAAAQALAVAAAAAVVGALWWLSRRERRDRRRVLGALAGYAGAAVGLSAVSAAVAPEFAAAATFVEEAGEALTGVAFLTAVLLGVAPRLLMPAEWALRREADAETLELPEPAAHPELS